MRYADKLTDRAVIRWHVPDRETIKMRLQNKMNEKCAICGCLVHRGGDYAKPTVRGRSHATRHHHVAERFFGRSTTRRGTRDAIFANCPWDAEGTTSTFCYECHEELIHNPVFLPEDVQRFAELVSARGLDEQEKTDDRNRLAGRIQLLHDVIRTGLKEMEQQERGTCSKKLKPSSSKGSSTRSTNTRDGMK